MGGQSTSGLRTGGESDRQKARGVPVGDRSEGLPEGSPGYLGGPSIRRSAPRPTSAQRRYLERGLSQPGGKLPLFDLDGQEIDHRTIRACIEHGWAEPWFPNPVKPDWVVCRVTARGRRVLDA